MPRIDIAEPAVLKDNEGLAQTEVDRDRSELLFQVAPRTFLGLRYRVRPNAFLQTNTEMAATLYELAREAAALTGSETVYDLYCGTGTIGLTLARDAASVWGVEISEESVACAIDLLHDPGETRPDCKPGAAGPLDVAMRWFGERPRPVRVDAPAPESEAAGS